MDHQFRSIEKSVSDYFAKLKEKERILRTKIEEQEKNEKEFEATRNHLQQEIDLLKVRKAQMEERLSSENYSISTALTMSYQHYKKQHSGTENLIVFHKDLIKKILECFKKDLEIILQCSSTEVANEIWDTRDTYQVYGLLLSACSLRKEKPNPGLVDKVLEFHTIPQQEYLKDNVSKAVVLTQNMLTLLPPLVVTTLPQLYNEQLHETNRSTWDEFAALDSSRKLTYYRPILVYGNQLHVAMKGLVGNVEQQHQEQQQEQQEQQPQQQQVMQQPQQQHLMPQQPQQQHLMPQQQPQQQQLMPQQPQHQQLMLQQQQQHQLQQFQQQQQQHHWYQQQQGMPLATSYYERYERHGSQTRSASNQTCIQGHPHMPHKQVEDKGHKVSRGSQDVKRCAVCNKSCYNERQSIFVGPDQVVVHQHCHKCKICGVNMSLKLYYDELVCVKHINELTCRNCGNSGQLQFKETGYHCSCQDTIV